MTIQEISNELSKNRKSIHNLFAPGLAGVYAFFLTDSYEINSIPSNSDGLVYIGSTSNLSSREYDNHFDSTSTGFSTLRRSIGAILKGELNLTSFPRSSGASETNVRNYKFNLDGEIRLTNWMENNLEIGVCPIRDFDVIEKDLITELKPVLNLTGWNNPFRREIKALRKVCADEALLNRSINP